MAEPISWQALLHVQTMLQAITVANGYHTDLGAGPILTDRAQVNQTAAPLAFVVAGEITPVDEKSGTRVLASEMDITVEFAQQIVGVANPELIAHRGRADIVRALQVPLRGAPQGFTSLSITGSSISPPESGASVIVAQVTARAVLSESRPPA